MRLPFNMHAATAVKCRWRTVAVASFLFAAVAAQAQDAQTCGTLVNNYGPFDYRTAPPHVRDIVERIHFTPPIENLMKGGRDNPFGDDLAYTLRVFPNHHRALISLMRLAEREKTDKPSYANHSVDCYFERAMRFTANDPIVRMLFAGYLAKKNNIQEATRQLDEAIRLSGDNPFTQFNVGLVFLDMKNYDRALEQAHRAAEMGFQRTELKDRLVAAGKWVEPKPGAAAAEAPKQP